MLLIREICKCRVVYEIQGDAHSLPFEFESTLLDAECKAMSILFDNQICNDNDLSWKVEVQEDDTLNWIALSLAIAAAIMELADTYGMATEHDNHGQVLLYTGHKYVNGRLTKM